MNENLIQQQLAILNATFTPAAAITATDLFSGRGNQIDKVLGTVSEMGQHAVLYGERGVGKTSLANIITLLLQGNQNLTICQKVSCDPTETFGDIWRKVFKKITITSQKSLPGFTERTRTEVQELSQFLNFTDDLKTSEVLSMLEQLPPSLLIFDEFESVKKAETRQKFSYTIKALSDSVPQVTLLLVGVAENINSLIGDHRSIERCLKQIPLPRMSSNEIEGIIDKGLARLNLGIEDSVKQDIVAFSQGLPQYTHLITKYAAKTAINVGSPIIIKSFFDVAVDEAIENVQESIRRCYEQAILVNRPTHVSFKDIVLACVIAEEKSPEGFRAVDLQPALQQLTGRKPRVQSYLYYLDELCKQNRGAILHKFGTSNRYRFKFSSSLARAFVRLKMYQTTKQ